MGKRLVILTIILLFFISQEAFCLRPMASSLKPKGGITRRVLLGRIEQAIQNADSAVQLSHIREKILSLPANALEQDIVDRLLSRVAHKKQKLVLLAELADELKTAESKPDCSEIRSRVMDMPGVKASPKLQDEVAALIAEREEELANMSYLDVLKKDIASCQDIVDLRDLREEVMQDEYLKQHPGIAPIINGIFDAELKRMGDEAEDVGALQIEIKPEGGEWAILKAERTYKSLKDAVARLNLLLKQADKTKIKEALGEVLKLRGELIELLPRVEDTRAVDHFKNRLNIIDPQLEKICRICKVPFTQPNQVDMQSPAALNIICSQA